MENFKFQSNLTSSIAKIKSIINRKLNHRLIELRTDRSDKFASVNRLM